MKRQPSGHAGLTDFICVSHCDARGESHFVSSSSESTRKKGLDASTSLYTLIKPDSKHNVSMNNSFSGM
jgi:hypothetical protein